MAKSPIKGREHGCQYSCQFNEIEALGLVGCVLCGRGVFGGTGGTERAGPRPDLRRRHSADLLPEMCHVPRQGRRGPVPAGQLRGVSKRLELVRTVALSRIMPPYDVESDFGTSACPSTDGRRSRRSAKVDSRQGPRGSAALKETRLSPASAAGRGKVLVFEISRGSQGQAGRHPLLARVPDPNPRGANRLHHIGSSRAEVREQPPKRRHLPGARERCRQAEERKGSDGGEVPAGT